MAGTLRRDAVRDQRLHSPRAHAPRRDDPLHLPLDGAIVSATTSGRRADVATNHLPVAEAATRGLAQDARRVAVAAAGQSTATTVSLDSRRATAWLRAVAPHDVTAPGQAGRLARRWVPQRPCGDRRHRRAICVLLYCFSACWMEVKCSATTRHWPCFFTAPQVLLALNPSPNRSTTTAGVAMDANEVVHNSKRRNRMTEYLLDELLPANGLAGRGGHHRAQDPSAMGTA